MTSLGDDEFAAALELLTGADGPVSFAELRAAGVTHPAHSVYELQLAGHHIEQVPGGVRLLEEPPKASPPPRRGRVRRIARDD
jgi:hypothetical protein